MTARALPRRLNAVERDTLRVLFALAQGSVERNIACSLAQIAQETQTSVRTAARTIARLRARGLLVTRRRQRSAALIALTPAALPYCSIAVHIGAAPVESTANPQMKKMHVPLPADFIGDVNAFSVMTILERPGQRAVAPLDLARRYLENASAPEQLRLETLKNDDGLYDEYTPLTGYAALDEGIRMLAIRRHRKETMRSAEIQNAQRAVKVSAENL